MAGTWDEGKGGSTSVSDECDTNYLAPEDNWVLAHRISFDSGHPFTDRYGVRQNVQHEPIGMVKQVIMQWALAHNEQLGEF